MTPTIIIFLVVCALLGYRVISAVPSLLHTPLMSGMNALSGITVIGSIAIYATAPPGVRSLAAVAIILAMINVVGGFGLQSGCCVCLSMKRSKKLRSDDHFVSTIDSGTDYYRIFDRNSANAIS